MNHLGSVLELRLNHAVAIESIALELSNDATAITPSMEVSTITVKHLANKT